MIMGEGNKLRRGEAWGRQTKSGTGSFDHVAKKSEKLMRECHRQF
jgi:hypothetical protein